MYSPSTRHALLSELLGKDAVHRCRVAQAILDALDLHGLIADDLKANVVALLVQTEVFEPEQHAHPTGAADAGDCESLAAQIFGALDVGPDDQIVGIARVESGDDFEIMARGDRREHGAAAGAADVNAAGGQPGDQCRRAADENRLDVDAVLGKKALLLGEPERHDARGEGGVADDIFCRRRGGDHVRNAESEPSD